MGGFLLALAMQRWNLHRRIALLTVRAMGTKPSMVIAGFMIATGFMSMWVSNTATAVMMLPDRRLGAAAGEQDRQRRRAQTRRSPRTSAPR